LEYVPEHEGATAAYATLKSEAPPPGDKKTQGLLALATIYKGRGALEKAMEYYVEAVKEQPSSGEAQAGLAKVLDKSRTLNERHYALREPVARWLALELLRRDMGAERRFAGSPGGIAPSESKRADAETYNLLGVLYQTSGQSYGAFFYDLAIQDFERAIQLYSGWYQPKLYLGYTYNLKGSPTGTPPSRPLLLRAIRYYDIALTNLDSADPGPTNGVDVESIRRETKVRTGMAMLVTDTVLLDAATALIVQATAAPWNAAGERDSHLLYNLACWYSVAMTTLVDSEDASTKARKYLAYS
ncbi:MAG: hypothetical protein WKH64_02585, partial [Chloroflexia bacterium]